MPIDPNIALGVKSLEVPNPLNQYAQVAQLQNYQNQNALAQYQLGAAQRAEADTEALRNALVGKKYGTPEYEQALTGAYMQTGNVKGLQEYQKGQREADKAAVELQLKRAEAERGMFGNLALNPSNENVIAHLQDMVIQKQLSPEQAQQRWDFVANMNPAQRAAYFNKAAMTANERVGRDIEQQRVGLEGQRVSLEARRVKISEEQQKQASDLGFQQQLAQAKEMGAAAAKGDVAALQAYPKAVAQAEQTVNLIDQMIGKRDTKGNLIKGEKVHPGFEGAVGAGLGARYIPGTEASNFEALFNQVKGGAFLQAFEALKGGGAITEKEGEKGTAALTRMSLAQSEKEFIKAATEFQDIVRAGAQRANQRVSKIGGAPAPAALAAPAAPAAAGGVKFLGFE